MCVYSAVSSPLDCSKSFIHFNPWQICPFRHQLELSGKHSSHATIMREDYSLRCPPLSIARYSFINTAESTEASWRERKCPNFYMITRVFTYCAALLCVGSGYVHQYGLSVKTRRAPCMQISYLPVIKSVLPLNYHCVFRQGCLLKKYFDFFVTPQSLPHHKYFYVLHLLQALCNIYLVQWFPLPSAHIPYVHRCNMLASYGARFFMLLCVYVYISLDQV